MINLGGSKMVRDGVGMVIVSLGGRKDGEGWCRNGDAFLPNHISPSLLLNPTFLPNHISPSLLPYPAFLPNHISPSLLPYPAFLPNHISPSLLPYPAFLPNHISPSLLAYPAFLPNNISPSLLAYPAFLPHITSLSPRPQLPTPLHFPSLTFHQLIATLTKLINSISIIPPCFHTLPLQPNSHTILITTTPSYLPFPVCSLFSVLGGSTSQQQ
ncbi:hypothetical protein Pmani_034843 [Petrolisthes manimaculis]|uniref:Uncharacterized protein n=1 Tax=Petrolisthes manimaculis TaxID=1843537 RepID=A0AAE1NNI2_9EUCA|nr:hypothetical protein Pmani_034843 [Petrolisthes manimaculis]